MWCFYAYSMQRIKWTALLYASILDRLIATHRPSTEWVGECVGGCVSGGMRESHSTKTPNVAAARCPLYRIGYRVCVYVPLITDYSSSHNHLKAIRLYRSCSVVPSSKQLRIVLPCFTGTNGYAIKLTTNAGWGGSLVELIPFDWRVVGSNPALTAT